MPDIKVTCETALSLELDAIQPIQGELKMMTTENYQKLKGSIIDNGFNFPIFIWPEPGTSNNWCLDGHGRIRVLRQLRDEGFTVPPIPCVRVEAKDLQDAKRKVLLISSAFHTMTKEGLYEFMNGIGMGADALSAFELPGIDIPEFKMEFFEAAEEAEPDKDEKKQVNFEAYQNAAIKQVVLYYPAEEYQKILGQLDAMLAAWGLEDYSQVIWKLTNDRIQSGI